MKRVAVIAIFMAIMASLFAFPGYATTYNPTTYNTYTDAVTYNGVTYNVRVTQLKALSEGTSMLPGGMETIMLVSLQMTNNTSSVKAATLPKLSIDLSDERVITDVYTYGGDFTLGLLTGGIAIFYPGSEFSLDNNKVVVPPNKSLYCVGAIGLPAQLNQTGDGTLDTGLRGAHLYDKSNYSVTDGNYTYGNPVDLSSVLSVLNNIDSNIEDAEDLITNIVANQVYTGNYYDSSISTGTVFSFDTTQGPIRTICRVYRGEPVYSNTDIYYDPASDTQHMVGTIRVPISVNVQVNVNSPVEVYYLQYLNNVLPSYNTAFQIDFFMSDIYDSVLRSSYITNLLFKVKSDYYENGNYYVLPAGRHYLVVNGYIEYPADDTVTLPSLNVNTFSTYWNNSTFTSKTGYYPNNEYIILKDLYLAYSQVNGLDDIDDVTDDITDKSESAHTQEQSYFTQNAQAIEATGLSNYRFNGDQENGIGSVSHDFTLLWNALGGFNSIYIFSLTLSLALMVLRHAPGAIRSSRRNKEE